MRRVPAFFCAGPQLKRGAIENTTVPPLSRTYPSTRCGKLLLIADHDLEADGAPDPGTGLDVVKFLKRVPAPVPGHSSHQRVPSLKR